MAQSVSVPMPSKVEETMLTWRMLAVACGVRVIRARMALHGLALGYAVPGLRTGTDEDAARGGECRWGSACCSKRSLGVLCPCLAHGPWPSNSECFHFCRRRGRVGLDISNGRGSVGRRGPA